jgi:hypothetical protein
MRRTSASVGKRHEMTEVWSLDPSSLCDRLGCFRTLGRRFKRRFDLAKPVLTKNAVQRSQISIGWTTDLWRRVCLSNLHLRSHTFPELYLHDPRLPRWRWRGPRRSIRRLEHGHSRITLSHIPTWRLSLSTTSVPLVHGYRSFPCAVRSFGFAMRSRLAPVLGRNFTSSFLCSLAEPLQRTCLRKAQGDESPMNLGGLEPRLRPNEEVTEDVTLRILGKLERSKS